MRLGEAGKVETDLALRLGDVTKIRWKERLIAGQGARMAGKAGKGRVAGLGNGVQGGKRLTGG